MAKLQSTLCRIKFCSQVSPLTSHWFALYITHFPVVHQPSTIKPYRSQLTRRTKISLMQCSAGVKYLTLKESHLCPPAGDGAQNRQTSHGNLILNSYFRAIFSRWGICYGFNCLSAEYLKTFCKHLVTTLKT